VRSLIAWRGAALQYRQLYRLAAGGSRERLKARQFHRTSYPSRTGQTRWANIAAGYSQEPPAATFCDPTARWYECRVVVWSRDKAVPLQTLGTNTPRQRAAPFEDDDENSLPDEALVPVLGRSVSERSRDYESHPYCINPDPRLIASANMTVLNRNESIAWTNDKRRIRRDVIATSDT
jgi:hypothetical protein